MNLLFLILSLVCASPSHTTNSSVIQNEAKPEERIIKGRDAERYQFPYMVSIQHRDQEKHQLKHVCGASILSPSWVVSAARCFWYTDDDDLWIAVGGLLILGEHHPDVQTIPVAKIIMHPQYNDDDYDISVLKLVSPFSFTQAVQPVSLPLPNTYAAGRVWVSGWGATNFTPVEDPTTLQYLEMNVIIDKECSSIFSKEDIPTRLGDTTLCTLPLLPGSSTCLRDTGSPLVQNGTLVGIVHAGDPFCGGPSYNKSLPNVFAKVSVLVDFINEHVTNSADNNLYLLSDVYSTE